MKESIGRSLLALIVAGTTVVAAFAEDGADGTKRLVDAVNANPSLHDATWFEKKNVMGEWEKMMLIFGYAGTGDYAVCERLIELAAQDGSTEVFRCNPVE
ncbi:hypothetical protein [Celeribacter sp.]|uniref:hypothetical protein n=1 Tax=Celeribacter sp. TaxID=1890673 RepID=UPI003A902D6D